jgi:hypothetical protein
MQTQDDLGDDRAKATKEMNIKEKHVKKALHFVCKKDRVLW